MKRFISIIFFSGLLAFGVFCTVSAQEAPAVETKLGEIKEQIREEQEKIERLEEGIEEHKKRVRKSRTEEINLLSELEKIDSRLAKGRTRLTELKKELATQEKLIRKKIAELETVTEEKLQARKHIKRRLAAYYRMGEIGVLNATFSATGLPELLDFKEYFHHLVQYDQQVITDYKHKIDKITETKNALQREKDRMMQVIVQVKSQEEELTEIRKQRLTLLKRVNTEKRLYQRALEEIEQAAGRLNETIESLNREMIKEKRDIKRRKFFMDKKKRPRSYGFAGQRGYLEPPVQGPVVTAFGQEKKKFNLSHVSKGIDIRTVPGAEVTAIYDGKVVYAGHLRGYGNIIIIDHGQQYFSLLSRLGKILKQEGDPVSSGELIALMSDQRGLLGDGLHLEIRHGTDPIDPLPWFIPADETAVNSR